MDSGRDSRIYPGSDRDTRPSMNASTEIQSTTSNPVQPDARGSQRLNSIRLHRDMYTTRLEAVNADLHQELAELKKQLAAAEAWLDVAEQSSHVENDSGGANGQHAGHLLQSSAETLRSMMPELDYSMAEEFDNALSNTLSNTAPRHLPKLAFLLRHFNPGTTIEVDEEVVAYGRPRRDRSEARLRPSEADTVEASQRKSPTNGDARLEGRFGQMAV